MSVFGVFLARIFPNSSRSIQFECGIIRTRKNPNTDDFHTMRVELWDHFKVHKIPIFHLISWYENFVERHSSRRVSGKWPETMQELFTKCLFTKFLQYEITVFYAISLNELRSKIKTWKQKPAHANSLKSVSSKSVRLIISLPVDNKYIFVDTFIFVSLFIFSFIVVFVIVCLFAFDIKVLV